MLGLLSLLIFMGLLSSFTNTKKSYDLKNNILLGDEISPDNCRLWDLKQKNDTIVSLDKDRFRNDSGDLIEAYSEINRRINDLI